MDSHHRDSQSWPARADRAYGAGGVGTFAIQIAKWLGAHVTTTASKQGEALLRSLGCDDVIKGLGSVSQSSQQTIAHDALWAGRRALRHTRARAGLAVGEISLVSFVSSPLNSCDFSHLHAAA
jgi:D-arabinose 1-dehydrogenase-like Zn-dependent alcohol dehydrogenase